MLGIAAVVGGNIRVIRELVEVDLPLLVASAVFLLLATWGSPFGGTKGCRVGALGVYVQFTIREKDRYVGMLVDEMSKKAGETGPRRAPATGDAGRTLGCS
ncbi:hypothetical protein DV707_14645 (plasmid) [Halobellus limi]|uniref:Uncharacterized protein n=1 Tax=Halobellus limi TaxID=699433 RepID=A0A4D6H5A1_9EURY|nr:hypothetical protein [Halobellus limi]QCC49000.1 hypothetical protein DV707_14645 [Halobellus limi]